MELVHELQAVETEIGVPQTAVEIAVDDWASSTVADLEDRTVIRGGGAPRGSVSQRRRRRRGVDQSYNSVGTIVKDDAPPPKSTGARRPSNGRAMSVLAWAVVGAATLVVLLGAVATFVLLRASPSDIPTVANIEATVDADSVEFTWADPGISAEDTFQVATNDGGAPILQRNTSFIVNSEPGTRVCVTVAVNREGKSGASSAEKCVDVPE
jgi:hypothetical protein